jgi:hypothetical protein
MSKFYQCILSIWKTNFLLYVVIRLNLDHSISSALVVANCYSALTCFAKASNSLGHQMSLQSHDSYARNLLGISWYAAL